MVEVEAKRLMEISFEKLIQSKKQRCSQSLRRIFMVWRVMQETRRAFVRELILKDMKLMLNT